MYCGTAVAGEVFITFEKETLQGVNKVIRIYWFSYLAI